MPTLKNKPRLKKSNHLDFCHTHLHDVHSMLDGLGDTDEYVRKAKSLGMKAISITNHGNINSSIILQKSCDEHGIKPIFGVELYCVQNGDIKEKGDKRGHLSVWIKNEIGWKNVLKMLSHANLYYYYYRPRVDFNLVLENCEGLAFGSACTASVLNIEGGQDFFVKLYKKTRSCYIELMPHSFDEQVKHNIKCLELHNKEDIPIIVSNDAHYVDKEDAEAHDVLLAIQTKKTIDDPNRWRFTGDSFYMNSAEEMLKSFEEQGVVPKEKVLEGFKNTLEIARNCNYRIEKREIKLPEVPKYKNDPRSEEDIIIDICEKSFYEKFGVKIDFREGL